MNRRSPERHADTNSHKPTAQSPVPGIPPPRLNSTPERKLPFFEDFNMEHSCSNVTASLMAYSASREPHKQGKSRTVNALTMNTPSCIYLG